MTEQLHFHFSLSCIGERNGNPFQCSCLENPRDGGAWWAAVYGVAQSRTQLKRLSSSSSSYHTLSASRKPVGRLCREEEVGEIFTESSYHGLFKLKGNLKKWSVLTPLFQREGTEAREVGWLTQRVYQVCMKDSLWSNQAPGQECYPLPLIRGQSQNNASMSCQAIWLTSP